MPTGYTSKVMDGMITEFRDFALHCVRINLVAMRDDPPEAPIPEVFEPSPWYRKQLATARRRLRKLEAMSMGDAEMARLRDARKTAAAYASLEQNKQRENARLLDMAKQVETWQPPTPEHADLKRTMLEQLEMSMERSAYEAPAEPKTAADWLITKKQEAAENIRYWQQQWTAKQAQAASMTEWVRQLRASLPV